MNFIYRTKWRRVFGLSATFLIALFLTVSCKKKDSNLGANLLNENQLLNSAQIDTFSLKTYTVEEDSVITDNPVYAVLGSYNDPKFGTFNANFYTQFRLSGLNPNFGDVTTITIDSTILGLEYASTYGDMSEQKLEVFELTESMYLDSTYYSFSTLARSTKNLVQPGFENFVPKPSAVTVIGEDTVDTQLRIRLKNILAQKLINEATSGGVNFSTNDLFMNYFKGLHVRVNNGAQASGEGGVLYFNLNAPLSKMTIYYTQAGVQKKFDFLINSECADFNHVDINNSGKPIQAVIEDTISGQKEFYAQAFKNRAVVRIPGIGSIPVKAIIHKAELIFPVQYQTNSKYLPSSELSVSVRIDDVLSGVGVIGYYDNFKKQYTMDVKNYLQAYVSGQIRTKELILSPRFFVNSAERIVFNGPNTINKKKPQLIITYTEF